MLEPTMAEGPTPMSDSSFLFVFEGPAFADGEIDVRDLAPALLALGDVVRAANRAVNGDRAEASLKLRATNEGSFEALLSIDVSWVTTLTGFFEGLIGQEDHIAKANDLLDLLLKAGAITGGTLTGAFALLKWLKGRRPTDTAPAPDGRSTIITSPSGQVVVDNRTILILNDPKARAAIETFADRTARIEGLTAVRFDAPGRENDLRLTPEDLPALHIPEPEDELLDEAENERVVWLRIVSSSFREGYLWRFTDGGDKPFTASVEDTEFLKQIDEGKIALSPTDSLKCRVIEEQRVSASGIQKSVRIAQVLEYVAGARQLPLV